MWIACPPKDTWHPWIWWGGVTSNRCPPCGYIWTPLPLHPYFALAPIGSWSLNNHCHSEAEMSWRAHIVSLSSGIIFYPITFIYICHSTYILHSTCDTIIHCGHFYLPKIRDSIFKQCRNLYNVNTYFGSTLHNRTLFE